MDELWQVPLLVSPGRAATTGCAQSGLVVVSKAGCTDAHEITIVLYVLWDGRRPGSGAGCWSRVCSSRSAMFRNVNVWPYNMITLCKYVYVEKLNSLFTAQNGIYAAKNAKLAFNVCAALEKPWVVLFYKQNQSCLFTRHTATSWRPLTCCLFQQRSETIESSISQLSTNQWAHPCSNQHRCCVIIGISMNTNQMSLVVGKCRILCQMILKHGDLLPPVSQNKPGLIVNVCG